MDAQASLHGVGLGAWFPTIAADGSIDKGRSSWLSVQVTSLNAPWAFAKDGETIRVIASLEVLAVLLAVKYLLPVESSPLASQTVSLTRVFSDNRGNGHVLSKLATTKFTLSAVVMELAFEPKSRGLLADVAWVPRGTNVEADALANGVFDAFNPALRVKVDLATVKWHYFSKALALGQAFQEEVACAKASKQRMVPLTALRKKRRDQRLRVTDPW